MIANFWNFAKEYNSTAKPGTVGQQKEIQLKSPTSILSPTLLLSGDYDTNANYVYISKLRRYYKITACRWASGLWEIDCAVDVLASWRDEIGAQSLYVTRASADSDGDIIDNAYPAQAEVVNAVSSYSGLWDFGGFYIIGVLNDRGGTSYYELTPREFRTLCAAVFSDSFFNLAKAGSELIKAQFNPMQYLSSCMWFPLPAGGGGRAESIKFGWWDTGVSGVLVPLGNQINKSFTLSIPKHPQAATRGKYLNAAPYSQYVLDLRPFGRIAIDPASLYNLNSITCNIAIDQINGAGVLSYLVEGGRQVLAGAQVGVTVEVGQISHDYIGAAASIVTGAGSGAMSLNPVGAVIGAASSIGNALGHIAGQVSAQGVNGGQGMLYGDQQLTARFYQIVPEDIAHHGRPLCQIRTLSTIPGFIMCTDADIKIGALEQETAQIRQLLEEGIIYV